MIKQNIIWKRSYNLFYTLFGLILQLIYVLSITVFNFVRIQVMEQFSLYPIAFFELFIGAASFICGLIALKKQANRILSFFVMALGILITFLFVFIYLLPEAGMPPPIPLFYSE